MDVPTSITQLSNAIIEKMEEIVTGDGEIKKAEAETILILTQALQNITTLPAQLSVSQTPLPTIRAIPANSVQPA